VGNTSLLLSSSINAIKNKNNLVSNIIKMRDSVGALYIHGKEPDTDMITEEAYSLFFKIKLDGKLTYEMKGTWERNDFMSGPLLITYT
jgi:isopenicillin N synthase-like dioxygenase